MVNHIWNEVTIKKKSYFFCQFCFNFFYNVYL